MSLASLVNSYRRTPSARLYLDGQRWYGVQKLHYSQKFGENIGGGSVQGRDPPLAPRIGMAIRWTWGYNGYEAAGCTGEVADIVDFSYPDRWQLAVKDVLWRADKSSQVLQTSPLNDITAKAAVVYLLTHYGGISASRLSIPALNASGSAWGGSEWVLGTLTPVQWGDTDTESGGTTALKAAAEICSCLGYWLYADSGGVIRAKQMERKPSTSAREVFRRAINLLVQGAPERHQSYDQVFNQVTVHGGNTGVDGAQLFDQYRTTHPLLPASVYRDFPFSSFLLEYENEAEAGAASVTEVAKRILNVVSRIPDVVPLRVKADPNRKVGDTVGIIDTGIATPTQRNFFIYQLDRDLDLDAGRFDDTLSLDGGTGNTGFTTVPPPDASFSWTLMAETLDGTAVVEVFLDGSAATSPSGEIVSWAWSTSTTTYSGTPNSATGATATLIFEASDSPAVITLTVTDTTSKTDTLSSTIDLTGVDSAPPVARVLSVAFGAAWYVTPDGGATWAVETANGDAVAVPPYGAGIDSRASGTAPTYGLLATRGSAGVGVRQTLDALATASTNLASIGTAIRCMWVNEANPGRVWVGAGDTVYRSTDAGATFTAMAKPAVGVNINWIIEDPSVDDSVFVACGANVYNATAPTLGWALLYAGPVGAIARQFVRSRDGQVTWIAYTGAPAGEALQRIENGAAADIAAPDIRALALDRDATSLLATLYAATADNPAQLWSFNGLTGLSAVQSAETFPSGATVQHMLADPDAPLIYAADFDSVAVGRGAVRKWFPEPDQLLLMKAGAAGQQAHMLGFGGPVRAPVELLLLPYGVSGANDKIWRYRNGAWAGITPPYAAGYWTWIAANPFAPDSWLLLGNTGTTGSVARYAVSGGLMKTQDLAHSPLWLTTDAGVTWTPIDLPSPVADAAASSNTQIVKVEWSRRDAHAWFCARQNNTKTTSLWRGTDATAAAPITDSATVAYLAIVPGADDDVYFPPSAGSTNPDKAVYVDTADVWHVPTGSAIGTTDPTNVNYADYDPLSRQVVMATIGGAIYAASDYRAAQPTVISGASGASLALVAGVVFLGSRVGIGQIDDPFGSPVVSTAAFATSNIGIMRADRQTHTAAAARDSVVNSVVVYSDGVWSTFAGPAGVSDAELADQIEVIVRT